MDGGTGNDKMGGGERQRYTDRRRRRNGLRGANRGLE
jgi:hypothetical protein